MTEKRVKAELEKLPPTVSEEFERARMAMADILDESQLAVWEQAGLDLASQTVRSWEAAAKYFKVSGEIAGLMPFSYFVRWAECGAGLCRESPTLAGAFFDASPGTMARLRSRHIETWSELGRSLYKGTWKSGTLACKFFDSSPVLIGLLTLPELEKFVAFLEALSHRSYDLSIECLTLSQKVFPHLADHKEAFISLAALMTDTGWRQVKGLFDVLTKALPSVESGQRLRFLKLAERLVKGEAGNVPAVMLEVSQALAQLDKEAHARLLELAEELMDVAPAAMPDFIRSCPAALQRVTPAQLEKWFEEGVRILKQNQDGGLAYFRVESAHSQEVLEGLSSSVEFSRVKDLMETYCRALAGSEVSLAPGEELIDKNIGWVSNETPTTEGSTVYVPSQVDRYGDKEQNFAWFKVVSTHQVGHLEFGSFRFEYDRQSALFRDLRPKLNGSGSKPSSDGNGAGIERAWVTDMQRFFDIFDDRKLALDIFTVVEDARLDARVMIEYSGIKASYLKVQNDALEKRRDIQSLPMREALVEFLVRISLRQSKGVSAPKEYLAEARKIARIAKRVTKPEATVEDSAEATLRIYAIIAQVPNESIPPKEWEDVDLDSDDQEEEPGAAEDDAIEQLLQGMGADQDPDADDGEYSPAQDVDFRGDLKPELVQLLNALRQKSDDQSAGEGGEAITQEMMEEMLGSTAELDFEAADGDAEMSPGTFADNMLKEAGLSMPNTTEGGQGQVVHVDDEGGALEPEEPQTFVYDEWDFRADDFKPRWCIVRQKSMAEGDPGFYGNTLHGYASLVNQIRRQFEMMVPEMMRKVRKLEDGEEIDIDDVIEAFIDIRTGVGPSEKLFWRRNKVQRDVAVVFLLDTSASTAEAIDEARKVSDDWDAPDDPVEYMVWLRNRRSEGMRRSYKRIIDLEKEAVVLLINALESIGDTYGIYGFSGYGRENVEFYNIKDIGEQLTEKVKSRIDRIAPLHATRMGPAIRHATSKLETQEARTKLLFLISDGRPQDRGYSREGVEKEYAVHDTKMALDEARDKDITAFCLTVDKNGHDYLKTMCEDIGYEVLDDIYALPQRLLYLYKRLTM